MKYFTPVYRPKALTLFLYVTVALLLISSLSACSDLAVDKQLDSQSFDKSSDDQELISVWETLRDPQATNEQYQAAIKYLADSPSKLRIARLSSEVMSESDVRTLLKTPAYINLIDMDFSGFDLSGIRFIFVDLTGTNLSNSNLTGSDFQSTNLSQANLSGANLSTANLSGANLSGVDLTNANLSDAVMFNVELTGANLSGVDLSGVRSLNDTRLNDACGNDETIVPTGFSVPACRVE